MKMAGCDDPEAALVEAREKGAAAVRAFRAAKPASDLADVTYVSYIGKPPADPVRAVLSAYFALSVEQLAQFHDLHAFLEVGKDFSNWIKDRITAYDFKENSEFVVFAETGENPSGGRPVKEYALTLDMAKELSMVERNAKGKEAPRAQALSAARSGMTFPPAGGEQ